MVLHPDTPGDASERRHKVRKFFLFASSLAIVAFIGLLDYQSGHDVSLLLFYLIPILQATWFVGRGAGIAVSFTSAATWYYVNQFMTPTLQPPLTSFWNASVRLGIFLLVTYIVSIQTALKRALRHEKELARTDSLTGTLNSRAFAELATQEIARMKRSGRPFSLASFDLHNFRLVNDTAGHAAGDFLLNTVAFVIRKNLRPTDYAARLGGDEFAVLLTETGIEGGGAVVAACRQEILDTMAKQGWPLTLSIALITFTEPPASFDAMMKLADAVTARAKATGKNRLLQEVFRG